MEAKLLFVVDATNPMRGTTIRVRPNTSNVDNQGIMPETTPMRLKVVKQASVVRD